MLPIQLSLIEQQIEALRAAVPPLHLVQPGAESSSALEMHRTLLQMEHAALFAKMSAAH